MRGVDGLGVTDEGIGLMRDWSGDVFFVFEIGMD